MGLECSAAQLSEQSALLRTLGTTGVPALPSDAELGRIRARRQELFDRWEALAPGGTPELAFDPA